MWLPLWNRRNLTKDMFDSGTDHNDITVGLANATKT